MKLEIEALGGGSMTLDAFAELHGLTMRVVERSLSDAPDLPRFCATFARVERKGNGVLISDSGNGATIEEAVRDYAARIAGRRLVFDAYGPCRKEFTAPNIWLDPAHG